MLEKIKSLKSEREKKLKKLQGLKTEKTDIFSEILAAEDEGKDGAKLREKKQKIVEGIEIAEAGIKKIEADMKTAISDLIATQLKNYQREEKQRAKKQEEVLRQAGRLIGVATQCLEAAGPEGAEIGSALLSALKLYPHITQAMIEGRSEYLNEQDNRVSPEISRRSWVSGLRSLEKNPADLQLVINKYFNASIKGSWDILEGA